MLDWFLKADSHGQSNPNSLWLRDEHTGRPPVMMAGMSLQISVALTDNGQIAPAPAKIHLEIKPERTDREDSRPLPSDPWLLRKTIPGQASVPTPEGIEERTEWHGQFTLTREETSIHAWRKLWLSVTAEYPDGQTHLHAHGSVQLKHPVTLPHDISPLRALDLHHALIRLEGRAVNLYYISEAGDLEVRTISNIDPSTVDQILQGFQDAPPGSVWVKLPDGTIGWMPYNDLVTAITAAAGAGDMAKADYDTNADGRVNAADHATQAGSLDGADTAGPDHYYGTDHSGAPGFHPLPPVQADAPVFSALWTVGQGSMKHTQQTAHCMMAAIDSNGALRSWGCQYFEGILGIGVNGHTGAGQVSTVAYRNSTARPVSGLANGRAQGTDKVIQAVPLHSHILSLTESGQVYVQGEHGWGGSVLGQGNANIPMRVATAIRFGTGAGTAIKAMAARCEVRRDREADAIFIDVDNGIWILSRNRNNFTFSSGASGLIDAPLKISPPGFSGKTPVKADCDGRGSFLVLFSDGELWATAYNSSGWAGTGATGHLPNFTQIATGVTDFLLAANYIGYTTLYTLSGSGTLKAAGCGGRGQLGQGNTANSSSFVTVDTGVTRAWAGGWGNCTLVYEKSGNFHGLGSNHNNHLGLGHTHSVTTPTALASLNSLAAARGGITDIVISEADEEGSVFALFGDGTGAASGGNSVGQLGVGDFASHHTSGFLDVLLPLTGGEKIISIAPALYNRGHCMWLSDKGRLFTCGEDDWGFSRAIIDGGNRNFSAPQPII